MLSTGVRFTVQCRLYRCKRVQLISTFFDLAPTIKAYNTPENAYERYLINCVDASYKNGTAFIEIRGGTFVNVDPSNNAAEGEGTNFVADGYTVISEEQTNGDTWYTVVAE